MAIKVKVHPPLWRLMRVVGGTTAVVVLAVAALRFVTHSKNMEDPGTATLATSPFDAGPLLLPVLALPVSSNEPESSWITAFAREINGISEFRVEHGRVDVITVEFAFELDRIEKWHEGIGQALHYASATDKRPGLALILSGNWPPDSGTSSTLAEIDKIASKQGIRLVLLRSSR